MNCNLQNFSTPSGPSLSPLGKRVRVRGSVMSGRGGALLLAPELRSLSCTGNPTTSDPKISPQSPSALLLLGDHKSRSDRLFRGIHLVAGLGSHWVGLSAIGLATADVRAESLLFLCCSVPSRTPYPTPSDPKNLFIFHSPSPGGLQECGKRRKEFTNGEGPSGPSQRAVHKNPLAALALIVTVLRAFQCTTSPLRCGARSGPINNTSS